MEHETNPSPERNVKRIVISTAILVVLAIAVLGMAVMSKKDKDNSEQTALGTSSTTVENPRNPSSQKQTETTPSVSSSSNYKDGTYSADGNYQTPGGTENIGVKLTVTGGKVTAADVTSKGEARESKEYQGRFISGYKDLVVGKSIDEIKLDKVSGSSLTPKGFTDALDKIKQQAKG